MSEQPRNWTVTARNLPEHATNAIHTDAGAIAAGFESALVHATVVDRFERHGQRAVIDVVIEHEGRPIATLEHEAIVDLTPASG